MKKYLMRLFVFSSVMVVTGTVNAQWVRTNGPAGNSVLAIKASGVNIFAGNDGGGVYLTTNNGTIWTQVNSGLTNLHVYSLATSGGNVLAGTYGGGVYLTTNNGTNWTPVNSGLENLYVLSLVINGGNVFAGTSGGVYLTTNNGANWAQVNSGLTNLHVFALLASGGNVFAGTSGGVFLTTNNGTSWVPVNTGLANIHVLSLAANGGNIYAGTDGGGVYLTTNNGTTWAQVNTGLPNLTVLALAASGGNIFAGTAGGGVSLTANNGTNWIDFNAGLTILDGNVLEVIGANIFAGTLGPVYRRPLSDTAHLPALPALSSPVNAATNVAFNPTMIWNAAAGATSYHLQVSRQSSFTAIVFDDSTLSTISKVIGPFFGATINYWRVSAKNAFGTSAWSPVWSFTTIWSPPEVPVLSSPADGATIIVPNPKMIWNASSGAASYTLDISAASDFSTTVIHQANIGSTSHRVSALADHTTCYWRVNAVNPAGISPWSDTRRFTIAVDTTWGLVGYWNFNKGVDSIAEDSSGYGNNGIIHGASWCDGKRGKALSFNGTDGYVRIPDADILNITGDLTVAAWVRASQLFVGPMLIIFSNIQEVSPHDGYQLSLQSDGRVSFYSQGSILVSISPIDTAVWTHVAVTLSGTTATIYVNGNSNISGTVTVPKGNDLDQTIGASNTPYNPYYFFDGFIDEVRVYERCLSPIEIMGIINPIVTNFRKDAGTKPDNNIMFMRNYPNPFKSSTAICYRAPENGPISLRIYSSEGRLVKTLVNGSQTRGYRTVTWDGSNENGKNMSGGVYLYQLIGKGVVLSKKMYLLE